MSVDRKALRLTFNSVAARYHRARADVARPDGLLRRHWGAVLHVARRRA